MTTFIIRPFAVVSGAEVQRVLLGREKQIVDLVEARDKMARSGHLHGIDDFFYELSRYG